MEHENLNNQETARLGIGAVIGGFSIVSEDKEFKFKGLCRSLYGIESGVCVQYFAHNGRRKFLTTIHQTRYLVII